MTQDRLPKTIPLFPLPATVLFPKTYLPLHIFEPRYREMVEDALNDSAEAARMIGMVLLKENWGKDYYGNPPIHPIGCIGQIMQVHRLNDGRYNLVLYGQDPFQVKKQFYDKSYRRAWIEPFPARPAGGRPAGEAVAALSDPLRSELVRSLQGYAQLRGWENQITTLLEMRLDDERLVQLLSSELDTTPIEKQFLLESEDLAQQSRRLIDLIGFMTEEYRSRKEANRPWNIGD
ncbi:MAG: LON peptidase substrate-binding domain-containing protein [Nitrospirae bacterium]|nr:LON peptidase substrate-binding domain-containing protein [Nitrospirota bacterium]